jgi:hypothetical protein
MGATFLPGKKGITLLKYLEVKFDQVKITKLYQPKAMKTIQLNDQKEHDLLNKKNEQKVKLSGPPAEVKEALDFLKLKMEKFKVLPTKNQD